LLGITTLELGILLVVIGGALAGVAVSLAVHRQRTTTKSVSAAVDVKGVAASESVSDESEDFLNLDSEPAPVVVASHEEGNETSIPDTIVPVPVSTYQSASAQSEMAQETFNPIATEPPEQSIPLFDDLQVSNPVDKAEIHAPPKIEEISQRATEQRTSAPESIALPTDSVAIENMTPAPSFPMAQQPPVSLASVGASSTPKTSSNAPSAYCVKCKSKKQMKDPTSVTMKNGRPALSGYCCDCGTRVFRIGKLSTF
jgi:hypothetical protein